MTAYTPKSPTAKAHQFNQSAPNNIHENLVLCTGGGKHLGLEQPLIEVPKGLEAFGATVYAVKHPVTKELTEVHNKDWIVYTEHGNILILPDALFNQLYGKL